MGKRMLTGALAGVVLGVLGLTLFSGRETEAGGGKKAMLAHMVYFSLKDNSADARAKLVAACKKYLSKHPGEVFFGVGTLTEDLKREVNDRDFDVALHLVFRDRAAHDAYQDAPRHKQFIDENKDTWKKVRVFDSDVQP
ncbi:MAG: Dabb family protein [Gemmataceae bacterium]|nr:Dabb family protein [Gemmataceae bacterium]